MTTEPTEYPGDTADEDAKEAAARREALEEAFPRHTQTVLRRIQTLGAVERAIDTLLRADVLRFTSKTPRLPQVDLKEWRKNKRWDLPSTFFPSAPVVDLVDGERDALRHRLVHLRGIVGLQSDAAGEALKKLLADADDEGISVPTTLDPVTPA